MKILVIIVSYNFKRWLNPCLDSLRKTTIPVSAVVIDNGSQDDTVEIIRRNYPEVRIIPTGKNLGFGRANNIGMRIALKEGFDYVFLMNQDAWVEPDTIEKLAKEMEKHHDYGILSPTHITGKGDCEDAGFAFYAKDGKANGTITDVQFVNAAFWMIPVEVLRTTGGFSPLFYHYGEDIDFANRVIYRHLRIGFMHSAIAYHDREYRQITHRQFMHSEYVYLLSQYANINLSIGKAFGYSVLAGIKKAVKSVMHGRTGEASEYMNIVFRLCADTPKVITTRINNTKQKPNYI
ncbi:glycosyltransferase family 2 protein [Xylanibacter muris]|uniref:Glycosyltransferase family 2 protein n=1 Tax=Xylanibacter muris TaxID=2736290 RepID=A0ABX2AJG0_9BACT|nr:glycosyltransferase family 2 protein [Xylanibacter muris]NPD91119.1 glycosyltransferase family 2 protein [Xylanibacter muris]